MKNCPHARPQSHRLARRGAITLEWVLLVTLLVIGIVGGLAAVRNATNAELTDLAEAIGALQVAPGENFRTEVEDPRQ
jgi:hypothetical protein